MLCTTVIPNCNRIGPPLEAAVEIRVFNMFKQQSEQRITLSFGHTLNTFSKTTVYMLTIQLVSTLNGSLIQFLTFLFCSIDSKNLINA